MLILFLISACATAQSQHEFRSDKKTHVLESQIENLIKKKPESVIFNVADDKPLSTVEVVKLIGDSLEKKVVVISPPKKIIHFISKIGGYLKLPFNEENLVKLTENYVVDNSLIKTELKISLPVTSEEGLAKTLKSFK